MLLRLFLDAGWPTLHSDCDWQWLDDHGTLLRRGIGDWRIWPGLDTKGRPPICELVLTADQSVCVNALLPSGAAVKKRDVVRFAIEDRIIGNIEDQHCVAGSIRPDGQTPVVTLPRSRLQSIIATLASLNLAPLRAYVDAQWDSRPDNAWLLRATKQSTCLVTADGWLTMAAIEATAASVPQLLNWAYAEAPVKPRALILISAQHEIPPALTAWGKANELSVELRPPATRPAVEAVNLLQGDFAAARQARAWYRHYRPLAYAAAVGGLVYALFSLGEWAWLAHVVTTLEEQEVAVFRATFPQVQTIVSAPLQMQRNLDAARQKNGRVGANDFLALLAHLAAVAPPANAIESATFENNRLKLKLKMPNQQVLDNLLAALRRRGLQVDSKDAAGGQGAGGGVSTTLTLSAGT